MPHPSRSGSGWNKLDKRQTEILSELKDTMDKPLRRHESCFELFLLFKIEAPDLETENEGGKERCKKSEN